MQTRAVFNLEFPEHIHQFKIGEYLFKRVPEYAERHSKLQYLVTVSGTEFPMKLQTGSHQQTATVEYPDVEKLPVLPWGNEDPTQLLDILLLLTIFTGRNILALKEEEKDKGAILENHGVHNFGGELILSLGFETVARRNDTGEILSVEEAQKLLPVFDFTQVNISFEKNLNKILDLISTQEWQDKYTKGIFLFNYRQIIQPRMAIETAFILSWSIWEHLFTLGNKKWMTSKTIETISGYEKISYIVSEYFLKSFDSKAKKQIDQLVLTRNRIVHYGIKPENTDYGEMKMFIRLTERLVAIILGLEPSNAFNSKEWLDSLAEKKEV